MFGASLFSNSLIKCIFDLDNTCCLVPWCHFTRIVILHNQLTNFHNIFVNLLKLAESLWSKERMFVVM